MAWLARAIAYHYSVARSKNRYDSTFVAAPPPKAESANGLFYYHSDQPSTGSGQALGSTAVLTRGDGGAILSSSVARYYPFGAYRTAPTATVTDREYTGTTPANVPRPC